MNFSNVTNKRKKKESRISPQEQRKARKEVRKSGNFGHQNLFSFLFSLSLFYFLNTQQIWLFPHFSSSPTFLSSSSGCCLSFWVVSVC